MKYIVNHFHQITITVIITCLTAWLGWRTWNKTHRITVAEKFCNSILIELKDIYPRPVKWPKDTLKIDHLLRSKFTNLQVAVEEFRRTLPWYKRKAFDKAWLRYRCSTGREIDIQCYHHYMPFISTSTVDGKQVTIDNSKTYKETFKHNVDTLLKFAKKT